MFENSEQAVKVMIILVLAGVIAIILGGIAQKRKKIMSKRTFLRIYIPLTFVPASMMATYVAWPGNSVNFAVRILSAAGLIIFAYVYTFFIWMPLAARIYPRRYKEFLDLEDDN